MPSFRKRVAVQRQPKKEKAYIRTETWEERNVRYEKLRRFLIRGINMYRKILPSFDPFSDGQIICMDNITTFTYELEIVRNGANEEREEVYAKYEEYIG